MNKSLIELSEEYEKSADILSRRISERNGRLKYTRPGSRAEAVLRAELNILYAERRRRSKPLISSENTTPEEVLYEIH